MCRKVKYECILRHIKEEDPIIFEDGYILDDVKVEESQEPELEEIDVEIAAGNLTNKYKCASDKKCGIKSFFAHLKENKICPRFKSIPLQMMVKLKQWEEVSNVRKFKFNFFLNIFESKHTNTNTNLAIATSGKQIELFVVYSPQGSKAFNLFTTSCNGKRF